MTTSTLHDAFLAIHADPLKANLAAVSAVQRILPCYSSVVPTEHCRMNDSESKFDAVLMDSIKICAPKERCYKEE